MFSKQYLGAYKEVDTEGRDNLPLSLKKNMKKHLFDPTVEKQYPVHGDGFTGAIVVIKISETDVPDDVDAFADEIGAENVIVRSSSRKAANDVR